MISDRDLQRWDDFMAAQIVALDDAHLAATGTLHRASPELVAFLKMNDGLVKERVEQAVSEFCESELWPDWLNGDQIVNLTHRANVARALLQAVLNRQLPNISVLRMPRANDRKRFIRWLLVDVWKMGGARYIDGLTTVFLEGEGHGVTDGVRR